MFFYVAVNYFSNGSAFWSSLNIRDTNSNIFFAFQFWHSDTLIFTGSNNWWGHWKRVKKTEYEYI